MTKYLGLILSLLVTFGVQAQKATHVEITIGEQIKLKKKELVDKIIGIDENGMYVMAKYGKTVTLFYYDDDLNLKNKNTFELVYQKHVLWYEGIIQMKDEFILLTRYRDKKKKMSYLYSQVLNKNTLTFSKPKELIATSYEGYKKKESASHGFRISADSNYLLLRSILPSHKQEPIQYRLAVYDAEMEEIWMKDNIRYKFNDEVESYSYSLQIGNDAKVYHLRKMVDTSRKYKRGEIDYTFKMFVYSEDEDEPEAFNVEMEGDHITDVSFERLDNGQIQVVGFFSTKGNGQNGVYNMMFDENYEVINETRKEFPLDFIVQHASDRFKKKAKKKERKGKEVELYSFSIDKIIENEDATITMIAEQYYTYTTSYTDANGNTHYTTHYVYGHIVIVKFDMDGAVEWMELIPKRQNTTDGGYYSSYAMMKLENGDLALVFNDNPKNSYYEETGKFYPWFPSIKRTDVILYQISLEGQLKRYILYKGLDEDVLSRPLVSTQVSSDEMIILGQARKVTKFVKLRFK